MTGSLLHDPTNAIKSGKVNSNTGSLIDPTRRQHRIALASRRREGHQARPHVPHDDSRSAKLLKSRGAPSVLNRGTEWNERRDRQGRGLAAKIPGSLILQQFSNPDPATRRFNRKTNAEKSGTTPTVKVTSSFPSGIWHRAARSRGGRRFAQAPQASLSCRGLAATSVPDSSGGPAGPSQTAVHRRRVRPSIPQHRTLTTMSFASGRKLTPGPCRNM